MQDKVCIVTGATSGIGEVTALELARMGARTVVVARNPKRSTETVNRIRKETGNERVEYLIADLSSVAEIHRLADEIRQRYPRLDVLVNNAGAFNMKRMESVDGYELTWAVNHLNYFLLTNLLLDLLKTSAPARIVNVSSDAHRGANIDYNDVQMEKKYRGWMAYSQSKFANVMFTYELVRRLDGAGITANVLHPGFVASNFAKNNGLSFRIGMSLVRFFARSPEEGAQTSIYLASSTEVEGVSGRYFVDKKPVRSDPASYDQGAAERLWEISAQMVGL